jgi:hypothetical protein
MKNQAVLIAHPKTNKEVSALKAFMKEHQIEFEVANEEAYNPEFVEKILEGKRQIAEGKFTEVKVENLRAFIDSL